MKLRELRTQFESDSERAVAAVLLLERLLELECDDRRTTSVACKNAVLSLKRHVENLASIASELDTVMEAVPK